MIEGDVTAGDQSHLESPYSCVSWLYGQSSGTSAGASSCDLSG